MSSFFKLSGMLSRGGLSIRFGDLEVWVKVTSWRSLLHLVCKMSPKPCRNLFKLAWMHPWDNVIYWLGFIDFDFIFNVSGRVGNCYYTVCKIGTSNLVHRCIIERAWPWMTLTQFSRSHFLIISNLKLRTSELELQLDGWPDCFTEPSRLLGHYTDVEWC